MELKTLIRHVRERASFDAGELIFKEGDEADVMYLVVEGQVRLSINDEPMGVESAGGVIGEMALIDYGKRSATATALTDCTLVPLDREQFVDMLRETPEFSLHVMSVLADRLRLANDILASI